MASSLRRQIVAAVVTALGQMSVANGYNLNWVSVQKIRKRNTLAQLPVALVGYDDETKSDERNTYQQASIPLDILCLVAQVADDADAIEDRIDDAVYDVEKALLVQKFLDPKIGITGVDDLSLKGHQKFIDDGELGLVIGAFVRCEILYRHRVTDPGVYP